MIFKVEHNQSKEKNTTMISGTIQNNLNGSSDNNNNNNCSSRWLTEEVFRLIHMVQQDEAIYNPRHKYYFCRPYVENFWREVDLTLDKNPGASLAKWTNLRISFRREYTTYLEEKVPPCWTYFDRMFFLHPYLRKKHQQTKSLDSQVQDALVQINSLSNRLQRQRTVAAEATSASTVLNNSKGIQKPFDNYLDYFDEPEQVNSELDELIDDEHEQANRFQEATVHSKIKSECDEQLDDFDTHGRNDLIDDDEPETELYQDEDLHYCTDSKLEKRKPSHISRLRTRSFHEETRSKNCLSQDSISSTHTASISHTNVSFVRPKFSKASTSIELVSTTTNPNLQNQCDTRFELTPSTLGGSTTTTTTTSSTLSTSAYSYSLPHHQSQGAHHQNTHSRHLSHQHFHHHQQQQKQHRLDLSLAGSPILSAQNGTATGSSTIQVQSALAMSNSGHVELCECKTDPDAMFLMSLLPDIQKLNGRDRGKIKIAFQNILQDFLYPD